MPYNPPPHNEPHLLPLLTGGRTALDVGANVGAWSYELLQKYDNVHAVEPQVECQQDLLSLKAAYRNRFHIHQFAAWCNEGQVLMQVRKESGMSSICGMEAVVNAPPIEHRYGVSCKPADFLNLSVDFIKIDTEGAEIMVLLGLQTTITSQRPDLLVEYHCAENRDWVIAWLKNRKGYDPQDLPINDQLGWIHAPRKRTIPVSV